MAVAIENWAAQAQVAHDTAVKTLVDYAASLRDQIAYRRALVGDYADVVVVPDATRRVYVQLGGAGGAVAEAQYDTWLPQLGDGVFVIRPRLQQGGGWLIIGQTSGADLPCFDEAAVN